MEYVNALEPEQVKVNILGICGSPRGDSNSLILLNKALEGAQQLAGVEVDTYNFKGKKIEFCRHCLAYCSKHLECRHKDDFQEFKEKWLKADGIIWSVPVYHMGPPAKVRAALDRLSEVEFHTLRATQPDVKEPKYPRFCKVGGTITQGGTKYGGQEITLQFFMNHFVLLDSFPVTGDMPESYLGVAGHVPNREALLENHELLQSAFSLGKRVAETAKIIKAGIMLTINSLPEEYLYSKKQMGALDRESFVTW